jgi:hypothetical protein
LPRINSHDPKNPEWRETPLIELDLNEYHSDLRAFVKNEADRQSNPDGLLKNRMAHEVEPVTYRHIAENLWSKRLNGKLEQMPIPIPTICTAGNAGIALANAAHRYGLPPIKLLLDVNTSPSIVDALQKSWASIYLAPLDFNIFTGNKEPYTPMQLRLLTNNDAGFDITSDKAPIKPFKDYYDWHWVAEIFNKKPDKVYGPFGTGDWFANGLTWQREIAWNSTNPDPRLACNIEDVANISILAAEPESNDSRARKLVGMKPFVYYSENDIQAMRLGGFTGMHTGIGSVSEEYLQRAYSIMRNKMETSYDGSAGLALLLKHQDEGKINPKEYHIVVNTGRGLQ